MNLRYTPAILFLLLAQALHSQNLIPFLGANGKYGYANEQGEIIVEPEYEGMLEPLTMLAPGFNAKKEKDGAFTLILRNGMKIDQSGRAAPMLNFNDDKAIPADSLHHILLITSRYKMALANLDTRLYREYFHYENLPPPPSWFPVKSNYMHAYKYNYGLYPVFREAGKMNFVDTAFNEIFSRDFFYGAILSNNYLLLADENKKMGIGDRQGQIRIPLEWGRLEPAKHEGYFLANAFRGLNFTDPHRAGMIDIDGKVIIDTIYQYIKTAGQNGIIVQSKEQFGLLDYSGNWILPLAFRGIFHAFDDYYLAFGQDGKANVYNLKGEKQFQTDYENISTQNHPFQDKPYFIVFDGTRYGVADSNFELLFEERFSSISLPRYASAPPPGQTQFMVSESPETGHLNVCDLSGKVILPGDYTAIELLPDFPEPLYLVQKGDRFGVFNTNGETILPLRFSDIFAEKNPRGNPEFIIWARPSGAPLFTAFDHNGQALPYPAVFKRNGRNRSVVEFVYDDKIELFAELLDGRRIPESEFGDIRKMKQYRTPDGGFLVRQTGDNYVVLDAYLKGIIPDGFVVPKARFDAKRLEATGLLAVYQLPQGNAPDEPQRSEPDRPDQPQVENMEELKILEPMPGAKNQSPEIQYQACGIMNAKGEWVMPPRKGVHLRPLSYHLVFEEDIRSRWATGYTIYRVNQKDSGVIEVGYTSEPYFEPEKATTMFFGKFKGEPKQQKMYRAYFDFTGQQRTDFNITDGESQLQERNLVAMEDEAGVKTAAILDQNGKIIARLGKLEATPFYSNLNDRKLSCVLAHERGSDLYGLFDIEGEILLPFQYRQLQVLKMGALLSCANAAGNTELLNWKGESIFSASDRRNFNCYTLVKGYLLAYAADLTVVLTPEGKLIRALPYKLQPMSFHEAPPNYALFLDEKRRQVFWMNVATGKEFR